MHSNIIYKTSFILLIILYVSLLISCASLKRDSKLLSTVVTQEKLKEIPVKHKYQYSEFTSYKVKYLQIPPYTVNVASQSENIATGAVNFPGRLQINIVNNFTLTKEEVQKIFTVNAKAEFTITRQGILKDSAISTKYYGKTFPNDSQIFTIAGTNHYKTNSLFLNASEIILDENKNKKEILIKIASTLFEKNKKKPNKLETGFVFYKDQQIIGFLNKVGRPRAFINTNIPIEEQHMVIKSMLFILIYNQPQALQKKKHAITFEDEQKIMKTQLQLSSQ